MRFVLPEGLRAAEVSRVASRMVRDRILMSVGRTVSQAEGPVSGPALLALSSALVAIPPAPAVSRAARALLHWTQLDLAAKARVGLSTVRDFERGFRRPHPRILLAIDEAFGAATVRFARAGEWTLIALVGVGGPGLEVLSEPAQLGRPSPDQCRAGRELLDWKQSYLAAEAMVGVSTVRDFEQGSRNAESPTIDAIQRAFQAGGVVFLGAPAPTAVLQRPAAPASPIPGAF